MKSRTLVPFVATLLCSALVMPAQGQKIEKRGQAAMTFLLINPSARAAGMGGSDAIEGEASALFQNPAGIANIPSSTDVMFSQNQWIADITQNAIAVAYRVEGIGVFGFTWVDMSHGDIFATTINKDPSTQGFNETGKVTTEEGAIGIGYAREITNKFAVGGHVKRVAQRLQDTRTDGIAVDFGLRYYTGYRGSRLTMSIRNFSKEVRYVEESSVMPLTFRIGVSADAFDLMAWDVGETNSLLLLAQVIHPRDAPEKMGIGLEYWYQDLIAGRLGYGINYDENDLSLGVGLKLSRNEATDLRVDYSFTAYGDVLDAVHRLSVGASF